jgi:hypothetical protein
MNKIIYVSIILVQIVQFYKKNLDSSGIFIYNSALKSVLRSHSIFVRLRLQLQLLKYRHFGSVSGPDLFLLYFSN